MWAAAAMFVLIFAVLLYLDAKKPRNYPPGPGWLPILGSALFVGQMRKKHLYLFKACTEMAREFGPVVGLKVGRDRQVVTNSYEAMKDFLTNDVLDGRPQGIFYSARTWGERKGLLVTDSDLWFEQRKFVLRQLRDFGFGRRTMAGLVEDEAAELVNYFKTHVKPEGTVMPMRDAFGIYVLNTLWTMLASIRYSPEDTELKTLQSLLTELFAQIDMVGCTFSQFPILRFIAPDSSGYTTFLKTHQRVWKFLKEELERHKATFKPGEPRDLMDVYLQTLTADEIKPTYSESQLLAICMDMFMAGSETTSKSLGFGFLYLVREPRVQKKAQQQLDAVVGRDRLPKIEDRPNLPYLEAIMLESVRMFMGRGFGIPHRAQKDTTLQGFHIPKDTMVIANLNAILMDPKLYARPHEFLPERYIDNKGQLSVPDSYLPFGFGHHRCMGEVLAKSNVFLFTASLLQNFNFVVPEGQELPTTECLDGVTPSPYPYDAFVTPR